MNKSCKQIIRILFLTACLFYFLFSFENSFAQTNKQLQTNFSIIDSLSTKAVNDLYKELQTKNISTITINIVPHPAKWLLINKIAGFKKTPSFTIYNYDSIKTQFSPILELSIKNISVKYSLYNLNNDSLIRTASVELSATLTNSNKHIESLNQIRKDYKDIISRKDVEAVKSQHDFANSAVPDKERTFFEEIAEPFIVVSTAIIIVALLFTVRSK